MSSVLKKSAACAAVATATFLGGVAPAHAAPAIHEEESVVGDVFVCAEHTYTITAGTLKATFHAGESTSGNTNFTGTLTPRAISLVDEDGKTYRLSGAVWFGETTNAQQGSAQGTFTAYINIIAKGGGVVDRVAQTAHFRFDGTDITEFFFDKGTCVLPD